MDVVSAYAPHLGLDEKVNKLFWEELDVALSGIPNTEKLFIGGDFNGHIGATFSAFHDVYEGKRFRVGNNSGSLLLDFARAFEL